MCYYVVHISIKRPARALKCYYVVHISVCCATAKDDGIYRSAGSVYYSQCIMGYIECALECAALLTVVVHAIDCNMLGRFSIWWDFIKNNKTQTGFQELVF